MEGGGDRDVVADLFFVYGGVVLFLPVTVLYLLMQRWFVKGLTAGAIK